MKPRDPSPGRSRAYFDRFARPRSVERGSSASGRPDRARAGPPAASGSDPWHPVPALRGGVSHREKTRVGTGRDGRVVGRCLRTGFVSIVASCVGRGVGVSKPPITSREELARLEGASSLIQDRNHATRSNPHPESGAEVCSPWADVRAEELVWIANSLRAHNRTAWSARDALRAAVLAEFSTPSDWPKGWTPTNP